MNISKPTTKRLFKTIYMYLSLCIGQYILCTLLFVFSEFVCVRSSLCIHLLTGTGYKSDLGAPAEGVSFFVSLQFA